MALAPTCALRDVLIAWINHRLEVISQTQHRLAVHRTVLQEQVTRLRLGAPTDEVELALKRTGLALPKATRHGVRQPGI
ncbi:MAG: hypothetical protein HYR51_03600 [Candidatus Rokubacteria bacterium]|nr:hypothetical protein [Candidatus Rokubacteria bacterium]